MFWWTKGLVTLRLFQLYVRLPFTNGKYLSIITGEYNCARWSWGLKFDFYSEIFLWLRIIVQTVQIRYFWSRWSLSLLCFVLSSVKVHALWWSQVSICPVVSMYFGPRGMRMGSGEGSTMRNFIVCTVHII